MRARTGAERNSTRSGSRTRSPAGQVGGRSACVGDAQRPVVGGHDDEFGLAPAAALAWPPSAALSPGVVSSPTVMAPPQSHALRAARKPVRGRAPRLSAAPPGLRVPERHAECHPLGRARASQSPANELAVIGVRGDQELERLAGAQPMCRAAERAAEVEPPTPAPGDLPSPERAVPAACSGSARSRPREASRRGACAAALWFRAPTSAPTRRRASACRAREGPRAGSRSRSGPACRSRRSSRSAWTGCRARIL